MVTQKVTANDSQDETLLENLLDAFRNRGYGSKSQASGWLLMEPSPGAAQRVLDRLDLAVRESGGEVAVGLWRSGQERSFGGLPDVVEDLAARVQHRHPEILQRFGWTLVNLIYPWRRSQLPRPIGELRAGLAEFALRGDQHFIHQFFQKRKVTPQVLAHLTYYLLESATAVGPVLLRLEGLEHADRLTWTVLGLLQRYARHHRTPLLICGVATEGADSLMREVLGPDAEAEWEIRRPAGPPGVDVDALADLRQALGEAEFRAISTASVFGLPFRLRDWAELLTEPLRSSAEGLLHRLLDRGVLRRVGEERFAFSHTWTVEELHSRLDDAERRILHTAALAGDEQADPFAAAWHGIQAELPQRRRLTFTAMERAWALSTYDCALIHATRALAVSDVQEEGEPVDGNLLLAMLNYEAERYQDADRYLLAALADPPRRPGVDFLRYLLGYNAIFGLDEFARGAEILRPVLQYYEATGDERGAAYVRNSLAFALFRSRQREEAITLEELNLDILGTHDLSDSFLLSILQLNLGRIYRNSGELERALELFRHGLYVRKSELTSHVLLLFYATLGNFHARRDEAAASLAAYRHSLELIRDMQIDGLKDQVLQALTKDAPPLPPDRVTRADEILFSLYFHLARACSNLGLAEQAGTYLAAVRSQHVLLGKDAVTAFETGLKVARSPFLANPEGSESESENPDLSMRRELSDLPLLVQEAASGDRWVSAAAEILSSGQSVALLRSSQFGMGARVLTSLVLYDPRSPELAARMSSELGNSYISQGTAALILEESRNLFEGLEPLPWVYQSASLKPQWRARVPGILPLRACVQVLSSAADGQLQEVLQAFSDRTGIGLLGVIPYHLWRNDLIITAEQGLNAFLVTSIDAFVLGDRLIVKEQGAAAAANLLAFHPRLSEEALVVDGSADRQANGTFLIRIKRRGGYATDDLLRLRVEVRPIVELCDGSLTVSQIVARASQALPAIQGLEVQVCSLLRTLWRQGALCFDPPASWLNVA
jgi:tetratricopeptide (TPR) repeat protein